MANDLRLQVIMDLANKASAPLRNISASSSEAAKALKAARDQLKQLNTQQAAVDGFTKQQAAMRASRDQVKVLQQNLDVLRQTQGAHSKAVQAAEKALAKQTSEYNKQKEAALQLRNQLTKLGIGNVSEAQARLKTETAAATAAIEQQRDKLKQLADQHKKFADLKAQHGKDMMKVGMAAGAGVGMQAAGRQGIQWGLGPIKDFAAHEDAMVGVQRQVAGARDESGRLTATYFEMERQIRELSGQIPVATTEIAKMFTAGSRMEVPVDQLKEFVRMASEIAVAFDAVPDEITESMGKVAKNFKIPITDIRGLADSINYLDDNAISKGDDIIDFMSRVAGTASMVKITAKETAALGSTLLTLGERRETASTAVNAVFSKLGAANVQSKKFHVMVKNLGMTTNQLESGMQTNSIDTIFKVMEAVRKMPKVAKEGGTSQIDAIAELFGQEHWDSFSKLLDNRAELERQISLANSQQAQGSMGRESAARNQALSAQWQMTENRAFNLSAASGETLKEELIKLLITVNKVTDNITEFVQENQVLVGWIMKSVLAVSAIIFVLGTLAVSLATIFGPLLLLRFIFARLGLSLGLWGPSISKSSSLFGLLKTSISKVIATISTLKGMNPMELFIKGIRLAGSSIGWLFKFIVGIGTKLFKVNPFAAVAIGLGVTMIDLYSRFDQLKALFDAGEWMELAKQIWIGIEKGLTAMSFGMYALLKEICIGAVDSVVGWFREKSGGGTTLVKSASAGLAAATAIGAPGMAGAAPLRIDQRPPLTSPAARSMATAGSSTNQITINAAPGMDPQAVARAVSAELDRRDRAQGARRRSSLGDIS